MEQLKGLYFRTAQAYNGLAGEINAVNQELALFRKYLFGCRSERFLASPSQLLLGQEFGSEAPRPKQTITYERQVAEKAKNGHGRVFHPDHLPRRDILIDFPESDKTCCGVPKRPIGEEITEELEYEPASLYVNHYRRIKYACAEKCEGGISTPQLPPRLIPKGIPGPSLCAHIIVFKYCDHLPLNRQEGMFRRNGVHLPRSTMVDWLWCLCDLLKPLMTVMATQMKASGYINADESHLRVLDRNHAKGVCLGFMWIYAGGGAVIFDYCPGRGQEHPSKFLEGFVGYLQTDAYAGYNQVEREEKVRRLPCLAHIRRRFFEVLETERAPAEKVLGYIRALYAIESRIMGDPPEDRLKIRQAKSLPILHDLHAYLRELQGAVLPLSSLGEAVTYALNQWPGMTRYAEEDGRLSIDNGLAERCIRPLALGRKNYIFAGSHEGAKRMAILYSIIGTCKLQGVEPFAYLRDLFTILAKGGDIPYADLTPAAWKSRRE